MVTYTDPGYQFAKRIKLGKEQQGPRLRCIEDRIAERFSIHPLCVLYEYLDNIKRYRLTVVLERERDQEQFMKDRWSILPEVERSIWEIAHGCLPDRKEDDVFLIVDAFEDIARAECTGSIPKERIEHLKEQLAFEGIWEISRFGSYTTFFFQTDAQLKASIGNGLREKVQEMYYPIEKMYDEFGYLDLESQHLKFDSRENFEKNYEGSWFYYYR
jgi:hypothetical protein